MKFIFNICFYFLLTTITFGQQDSSRVIEIDEWLSLGSIEIKYPAFSNTNDKTLEELLNYDQVRISDLNPVKDETFLIDKNTSVKWKIFSIPENFSEQNDKVSINPSIHYLATYIQTERFTKAELEINSCNMIKVYLDGQEVAEKKSLQKKNGESDSCKAEKISKKINIETGKHLLLIKVLTESASTSNLINFVKLKYQEEVNSSYISISTKPEGFVSIKNLLEDPKLGSISLSHDGKYAGVTISKIVEGTDKRESWLEIYNTENGKLTHSFKGGMKLTSLSWSPIENVFAYTQSEKEQTTVWITDITNNNSFQLLEGIKDFSSFNWSPDGTYIIYSVNEKPKEDKSGLKRFEGLQDRWPWARNKSYLYLVEYPSGFKQRLTSGDNSTSLSSISKDGNKILISSIVYDFADRPYSFTTYYILDRQTMKADTIKALNWARSVQFSPDGKNLLILGGPSMFGGIGKNLPDTMIPNDFDMQAFAYNLETKKGGSISREFDPSINSAYWSKLEDVIYFDVTEKTKQNLYKYELKNKQFSKINLEVEVLDNISFASDNFSAIYKGSGAIDPEKLYYLDLKNNKSKLLLDLNENIFSSIKLGKVEDFDFTNSRGDEIDGLVYYPPYFDSNKKYPCIVSYYGGTSPTEQTFEGRYPRNLWTANGYIVYALQPSGAIGYGQKFSAYHVNDWGKLTAEEIIEGTKLFLKSHPFVDEKRVGCIGASYGGFMTMNVLTKTDIFSAGISHAGISSLSSYWGEGYWGYLYSAVATANSFPWNRKDIYIDHSPLFSADKITTPLLLLHGASDTNVPPGESTQMYTALKILGKDVEYIQVEDQDHHILDYKKRKQWTKTIIAWFDYKLKGQAEWWNELYPDKNQNEKD